MILDNRQPPAIPVRLLPTWAIVGLALLTLAAWVDPACAVTHLKRGDDAPNIELTDTTGAAISNDSLRGGTVILIFGELYHGKTVQACVKIRHAIDDERLQGEPIRPLLVVTQQMNPEQIHEMARDNEHTLPAIWYDTDRVAFGAYRVAVLPSVVVIDTQGRVVHTIAALTTDFSDRLTDALLLATGKITADQFEIRSHPQVEPGLTQDQARARRLTMLAGQLSARGLVALAEQKYTESLKLDPKQTAAWVGMGTLKLKRGRLSEAELQFRKALGLDPGATDATLGLAFVMTRRGGDELSEAGKLTRKVIANDPSQPRAHYLLGLIHQQSGDSEAAADSFKRAAELLLDYYELEPTP